MKTIILLFTAIAFGASHLPSPTINVSPDVYYPFDEILYLEGRAKPAANVQIQFQKQGAKPSTFNVKSDANGEWVLAEKIKLGDGDWEVRARLLVSETDVSEWSNPRVFKVVVSGVTIGDVNIKFAFLSFALFLLFAVSVAAFLYFTWRVRRLQAVIASKEIQEAQDSVREGLSEIRKDILDELQLLESSGKQLSPEEVTRKAHLLRELDTLERNMERKIRDIENKNVG